MTITVVLPQQIGDDIDAVAHLPSRRRGKRVVEFRCHYARGPGLEHPAQEDAGRPPAPGRAAAVVAEAPFAAVVDAADPESVPVGGEVLQHFSHFAVGTVELCKFALAFALVPDLVTKTKAGPHFSKTCGAIQDLHVVHDTTECKVFRLALAAE